MSKLKPLFRELKEAAIRAGVHSKDKLPQLTKNTTRHIDDVLTKTRKTDKFDTRIDAKTKPFKKNPKHNQGEYVRQRDEQLDTLRNMSVADWLRNRDKFGEEKGRSSASQKAQRNAREAAFDNRVNELLDADPNLSLEDAEAAAAKWLKTQAATHRLDGVAGGDVTDISGVGDARVNSSLGSQWRSRVGDIDRAVIDFVNNNPGVDPNNVGINLSFG